MKKNGWADATFGNVGNVTGFKIGSQLAAPVIKNNFGDDTAAKLMHFHFINIITLSSKV